VSEGDRQWMQLDELWARPPHQHDALDRRARGMYEERFPYAGCHFDSNRTFSSGPRCTIAAAIRARTSASSLESAIPGMPYKGALLAYLPLRGAHDMTESILETA